MSKFAVEIVYTRIYTTNYVIEADNDFEAHRIVDEMLYDTDFRDEVAAHVTECDYDYEVGAVREDDDNMIVGEFFNE